MKFILRLGNETVAQADRTMLAAMGLPSGGVIRVGDTHVAVRPAKTADASGLLLDERTMANSGASAGEAVDVDRALLSSAGTVVVGGSQLPIPADKFVTAMHGRPVSTGDEVLVDASQHDGEDPLTVTIALVEPAGALLVGPATRVVAEAEYKPSPPAAPRPAPSMRPRPSVKAPAPSAGPAEASATATGESGAPALAPHALLAGLENELDMLTGWFTLLCSPSDLPATWGLPQVAGVIVDGPSGVGKTELVEAAAAAAGATVRHVEVDQVFKADKLLDVLSAAVKLTRAPGVIFVDRLEVIAGQDGLSNLREQVGAILRWFLDAVSERPGIACVLGTASASQLGDGLRGSALLPRTLSVPPPDLARRKVMLEHALARVPTRDVDLDALAARSAGFSGTDLVGLIVHASAMASRNGGVVTGADLMTALLETPPSLGAVAAGEIPAYGFERVAGLEDVKQRLTEAVIWPMTDPDRFARMGIDPPRGLLLYGPPGTGKTFVIKALAHEAGAAFFAVKGAELLDKYVGESERGVRDVFARARAASPSIIFFDELDALAPVRGSSTTSVTDSVVAAMLTELDGLGGRGDVVVIGATNRRDLIDPALLRSGRFEVHVELGVPDAPGRRALLDITDVPFGEDVDLDRLAERTQGLSFADMTGLLREAALIALRSNEAAAQVTWVELDQALDRFGDRITYEEPA